jgi:tetratricopeptide (TPR) repeat protein
MSESVHTTATLAGKRVAFTGRLASMTRAKAVELVRMYRGSFTPRITARTAYLVVGNEGWPLQKNGRLTFKLERALSLQRTGTPIKIVQEDQFLRELGLESEADDIRRLYSTAQLTRLLQVPRARLQSWINAGLVRPAEIADGINYFDYSQVIGARTLCELAEAGVKPERIRRSFEQLRRWLPNIEEPLAQLAVLEHNGKLAVRVDDQLVEPGGQQLFDFAEGPQAIPFTLPKNPASAEEWFELACKHEDAGRLPEAAEAYRQALLAGGPDRDTSFNLANVLYAMDYKAQAVERYYQVLELDRTCVNAWVNLGVVLLDLKSRSEARTAFEMALQLDPTNGNALYNLADLLDELGRHEEARSYWQTYARQDPQSDWGKYARRRLAAR